MRTSPLLPELRLLKRGAAQHKKHTRTGHSHKKNEQLHHQSITRDDPRDTLKKQRECERALQAHPAYACFFSSPDSSSSATDRARPRALFRLDAVFKSTLLQSPIPFLYPPPSPSCQPHLRRRLNGLLRGGRSRKGLSGVQLGRRGGDQGVCVLGCGGVLLGRGRGCGR